MNKTLCRAIPALIAVIVFPQISAAQGMSRGLAGSDWIGQLTGPSDSAYTARYSHVTLKAGGAKLSGFWGAYTLAGRLTGTTVEISLSDAAGNPAGRLTGAMAGEKFSGTGDMVHARSAGSTAAQPAEPVTWQLTRAATAPATPKTYNYEPAFFYGTYTAAEPPALHIFPGDTVNTRTIDENGRDAHAPRHGHGGDANTGPFYVEGALPGDTLVVKILKLRTNKPTAYQGSSFDRHAVPEAYSRAAKYDPHFKGEWHLDPERNIATLSPSAGLPHLTVPMRTMLGCISVAPPGKEEYTGTDLGVFGGNMDYNGNVEGTILYFPVFHPGALLGMGDVHAAMGDGEVAGTGLETAADVTFTVDVIRGYATQQVRAETKDYLIAFGVAASVPESIQISTSQLAAWIKRDYKLNDSEVAILFAAALKYDIAELVDPKFNVAAKIPKSVLAAMK